jgi:hypothetical protein
MARHHISGEAAEPDAAWMGELLLGRDHQQGIPGTRQLHRSAVAPVATLQAQDQTKQGRGISRLASLRALRARTSDPTGTWRVVGEGVKSCPRAGCGRSACPVVCPAKAGMFSRGQTCRGKSQSPVVWIAEVMETETLKPIDKVSHGGIYESPGRNKSERVVASKMRNPEGRVFNRKTKAA